MKPNALSAPLGEVGFRYTYLPETERSVRAGFKELNRYFFDTQVYLVPEFTKRVTSVRQVIKTICFPKQREALLEQLEEIVAEFKRRNIAENDCFLHRHYIVTARKI